VGPVDVQDVEGDGHLGDAPRLGHELTGELGGWHHIEHVDGVEHDRP
jgi:hypothetical protein